MVMPSQRYRHYMSERIPPPYPPYGLIGSYGPCVLLNASLLMRSLLKNAQITLQTAAISSPETRQIKVCNLEKQDNQRCLNFWLVGLFFNTSLKPTENTRLQFRNRDADMIYRKKRDFSIIIYLFYLSMKVVLSRLNKVQNIRSSYDLFNTDTDK